MSNSWIRADYDFGRPAARLAFSNHYKIKDMGIVQNLAHRANTEEDITRIAKGVETFIESKYPELKGVSVCMIQFEVWSQRWIIGAYHPLFPRTLDHGSELPIIVMDRKPLMINEISIDDILKVDTPTII